jgi:hypothetical protein
MGTCNGATRLQELLLLLLLLLQLLPLLLLLLLRCWRLLRQRLQLLQLLLQLGQVKQHHITCMTAAPGSTHWQTLASGKIAQTRWHKVPLAEVFWLHWWLSDTYTGHTTEHIQIEDRSVPTCVICCC